MHIAQLMQLLDGRQQTLWRLYTQLLNRRQTIDKVGQLFGRGLVSKDNRPMKSLNHDTRHLSRHDSDDKKWQTIRTPTLLCCFIFWPRNNINIGPPLVTRQVSNLLVVHFIVRLSLETKPRRKSWPTISIVWRRLYSYWQKCTETLRTENTKQPRKLEVSLAVKRWSLLTKHSLIVVDTAQQDTATTKPDLQTFDTRTQWSNCCLTHPNTRRIIQYHRWFALKNWQCQCNLAHKLKKT